MSDTAKTAQSIGYAIGVLEWLADMSHLDEIQINCIDTAVEGLREIDLIALCKGTAAQAEIRPTMRQAPLSLLLKVYEASEDGEGVESCCGGKHFKTTLMAGDRLYRLSYAHTKEFDTEQASDVTQTVKK